MKGEEWRLARKEECSEGRLRRGMARREVHLERVRKSERQWGKESAMKGEEWRSARKDPGEEM